MLLSVVIPVRHWMLQINSISPEPKDKLQFNILNSYFQPLEAWRSARILKLSGKMHAAMNCSHCSRNSGRKKSGYVFATTFPHQLIATGKISRTHQKKLQWLLGFFFNVFLHKPPPLPAGACSGAEVLAELLGISPGQWAEAASGASKVVKGEELKERRKAGLSNSLLMTSIQKVSSVLTK